MTFREFLQNTVQNLRSFINSFTPAGRDEPPIGDLPDPDRPSSEQYAELPPAISPTAFSEPDEPSPDLDELPGENWEEGPSIGEGEGLGAGQPSVWPDDAVARSQQDGPIVRRNPPLVSRRRPPARTTTDRRAPAERRPEFPSTGRAQRPSPELTRGPAATVPSMTEATEVATTGRGADPVDESVADGRLAADTEPEETQPGIVVPTVEGWLEEQVVIVALAAGDDDQTAEADEKSADLVAEDDLPHDATAQNDPVVENTDRNGVEDAQNIDATALAAAVTSVPEPEEDGVDGGAELEEVAPEEPADESVPFEAILESLLFVAGEPVEPAQLAKTLDTTVERVQTGLSRLGESYLRSGRGLRLQVYQGKYQLVTTPAVAQVVEDFLNLDLSTKLSGPALETLAVIAYRQPVTRAQVESVRGVDCAGVLRSLSQRGLIEEVGRLDTVGRPILYGVTEHFLHHFGLTGMDDLPPLEETDADLLWATTTLGEEEDEVASEASSTDLGSGTA